MTDDFNARLRDAEKGCAIAQCRLAYSYDKGEGVPQDYEAAVRYYTLAANQGLVSAQNNLGYMYSHGKGVVQNYSEAFRYYTLAAEQGNAIAQNNLGCYMYLEGSDDVPQKGIHYPTPNHGDLVVQNNLGWMYEHGKGVVQNYAEAVRYYTLAVYPNILMTTWYNLKRLYEKPEACKQMASDRDMAHKYCLGCGKQRKLKKCARCKVARFCSTECVQRTWTYHKPHCKTWENECE